MVVFPLEHPQSLRCSPETLFFYGDSNWLHRNKQNKYTLETNTHGHVWYIPLWLMLITNVHRSPENA